MPPLPTPSSGPPHSDLEVVNGNQVLIGNDNLYRGGGAYHPKYKAEAKAEAQAKSSPNKTRGGWVVPAIIGALVSAVVQCPTRHSDNEHIILNEHYFQADDNDWGTDH
ncbi:hypothetical protein DL765_009065 [Monosporascus sp. GIB2]|nr:hypothetical protein DL765_009065 [Monosporascus sp. GIB2]